MFVVAFFQCCICIRFCFSYRTFNAVMNGSICITFKHPLNTMHYITMQLCSESFFPCVLTDLDELKHRVLLNSMLNSNRIQDCVFFSLVLFLFRKNIVIYVKRISKFTFWSLECNEWMLQGDGIYGITSREEKKSPQLNLLNYHQLEHQHLKRNDFIAQT